MAITLPCKRISAVVEERGSESRELGSSTFAEGGWRSHKKQGVDVTLQVDVVMAIELHRRIGGCARARRGTPDHCFQHLGLLQPTIFQFAICLLLYKVVQTIRGFVALHQQRDCETISLENLFVDTREQLLTWSVLGRREVVSLDDFQPLSTKSLTICFASHPQTGMVRPLDQSRQQDSTTHRSAKSKTNPRLGLSTPERRRPKMSKAVVSRLCL